MEYHLVYLIDCDTLPHPAKENQSTLCTHLRYLRVIGLLTQPLITQTPSNVPKFITKLVIHMEKRAARTSYLSLATNLRACSDSSHWHLT